MLHGLTVGGVLKWYARELGYGDEADFWEICGILHDIDFEQYPEEHLPGSSQAFKGRRSRGGSDPCGLQPLLRPPSGDHCQPGS